MFHAGKGAATLRIAARTLAVGLCLAALAAPGVPARAWGDDPKPAAKDDDKLKELLQARVKVARELVRLQEALFKDVRADFARLMVAEKQLFTAQLEMTDMKEDRVSACEENLERWTSVKKITEAQVKVGQTTQADLLQAEYERLEAEILLEREKAK